MIEKWRRILDQGGICWALFTDFSKTFDCLAHDSILPKAEAYDFINEPLKLINSHLTDREHSSELNFCRWNF